MATIVVIDDDAGMRNAILWTLQRNGHTVLTFEDAGPALEGVHFAEVDLIITDLEMPLLGEQFIIILREQGIFTPVIVISAYLDEDRTRYLKDLGVHQILEKPFQVSRLVTLVGEMTEQAWNV